MFSDMSSPSYEHYFYAPDEERAGRLLTDLQRFGAIAAESARPSANDPNSWLVTVVTDYLWDAERVAQSAQFEQLAEKYDSEYDGGEVYVGSLEALSPKGPAEPVQSDERAQKPSIWRRLFGRSSP